MNSVLQFFASFSVAAIFIGALFMLCPEGVMSKTVKYTLSLAFICIIVSTAGITLPSPQIEIDTAHSFDEAEREMEITFARQVYARALNSEKINFTSIEVFTNKLDDGSIIISKVKIISTEEKSKIDTALKGLDPNIKVEVVNE